MTIATSDEITVTQSRSGMPNVGGLSPGFHTRSVRKFAESSASDGIARASRNTATAAMRATTSAPDPTDSPAKTRSPRRLVEPAKSPDGAVSISECPVMLLMRVPVGSSGTGRGRERGRRNAGAPRRPAAWRAPRCAHQLMASIAVLTLVRTESGRVA